MSGFYPPGHWPGQQPIQNAPYVSPFPPPRQPQAQSGQYVSPFPPLGQQRVPNGQYIPPFAPPGQQRIQNGQYVSPFPPPGQQRIPNGQYLPSFSAPGQQHIPNGQYQSPLPPPGQQRIQTGQYLPALAPPGQQRLQNGQYLPPFAAPGQQRLQNNQYMSPFPPLRQQRLQNSSYISPFPPPQSQMPPPGYPPFPYPAPSHQQHAYVDEYEAAGPVVHDGFIPAPGHEDDGRDDEGVYPTIPQELRNSMLQRRDTALPSSDEDDASSSEEEDDDEEALRGIADANDKDEDSDFAISDAEDADDADLDQDEELDEDELEEDLEVSDVHPRRRPGSAGGKPGAGGTRRLGSRVGSRSTYARGKNRFTEFDKRGKGGRHKGQRPAADPGPLFKQLQRSANAAYMGQKYEEAIEYANQAIQMNPEIFASHSLLSEIYLEMGREDKSIEALLVGAPTKRDKQLWFHILQRLWQLDEKQYPLYTRRAKIAIALDCLTSISNLDPNDFEARQQKLKIDLELGNLGRAINMCIRMLQIRPDETEILCEMAKLVFSNPKMIKSFLTRIIASYDVSIDYFLKHDWPGNLDWSVLNYYVELLERGKQYDKALTQIRILSRWIEGRAAETYWDQYDDDREWDLENEPRRIAVPEFASSKHTGYGQTIPLELRMKMGIYRIYATKPNLTEAMRHFSVLEPDDESDESKLFDFSDLYLEVAEALKSLGHYEEALRFYEPLLRRNPEVMTVSSQLGLHTCYTKLGRKEKAEERVLALKEGQPRDLHEYAKLAKFFEDLEMEDEALMWADKTYHLGGARPLQDVGYREVGVAQRRWWNNLRRYRALEKVQQASRTNAERKALEKAPKAAVVGEEGPSKEDAEYLARSLKNARKSKFGKRGPYKPRKGPSKRRERTKHRRHKSQAQDVQEENRLELPDRRTMRSLLDMLARELPEQLEEARSLNRELKASYLLLQDLSESAEQGVPEALHTWMELAHDLVKEFMGFKLFYYDRRQQPFVGYFKRIKGGGLWKKSALIGLAAYANQIEEGHDEDAADDLDRVPDDFHGIPFDKWFDLLCQYAVYSARLGKSEQCFTTLNSVCKASPFAYQKSSLHRQYLCRLACAIILNDSKQVSDSVRWMMKRHPFASDLYRLYNYANSLCAISSDFNTQVMQKTLLRFIKAMDHALLSPEQRKDFKFSLRERGTWQSKLFRNGGYEKYVKSHDPVMLSLFGHILCSGGTYPSALNYYFRAYAITPEDPVLNLCISSCYLQHCMKRLSENRQYQFQQGLSFALRYHALRTKANIAVQCQEAEFNMGRLWHMVGLTHLALPAYERCIALSKRVKEEQRADWVAENFAAEAAYGIQTILALAGDFKGARSVTEEVLVIE